MTAARLPHGERSRASMATARYRSGGMALLPPPNATSGRPHRKSLRWFRQSQRHILLLERRAI